MENIFNVAGGLPVALQAVADQLRRKISGMTGSSLLAVQKLAAQAGVEEFLVVCRTYEEPHIHPDADLIVYVLEGAGYFQLDDGTADAPLGSVVVIPKAVCHAFHNVSSGDTVLLATFSPKSSKADCPPAQP